MSESHYPCYGYVLEFEKLLAVLDEYTRQCAQTAIDNEDSEKALLIYNQHRPAGTPEVPQLICLTDEDVGADIEIGTIYALFNEDDLVRKTPTRLMQNLKRLLNDDEPSPCSWATWGD